MEVASIYITRQAQNWNVFLLDTIYSCIVAYQFRNRIIIVEDLNPGISKTFQVAFETSTKTTDETYIAKIGYSYLTSNSDRVNITLK